MYALLKKEVRSFLSSLIGYIVVSVFLLLLGLFLWFFNTPFNITENGMAELDSFFSLSPLVFLFLIPAITMRSFAEEKRTGTIELLLTRPLTDLSIILSKYFAGLFLVLFSLIPTLLYYYSVKELGSPPGNIDSGATWGSYIGLFMLGAGFVAIGIFSSALTHNQIIAFIIGVFLCFFFYLGFDFMGSYSLFGKYDGFVKSLGIYAHYHSISRGVVDTRDIIYFLSFIALFLLFTKIVMESRKKENLLPLLITLCIVVILNFISTYRFQRYDLTEEKRYSLSPATINYLENKLNDQVTFTVYLTGEMPSYLKKIESEIKLKLDEFISYAGDNIQYTFYDPYSIGDEDARDELMGQLAYDKKLNFTILEFEEEGKISSKYIFPCASISYQGVETTFPFFVLDRITPDKDMTDLAEATINNLEFRLMDALRKATRDVKPRIAVLEGHGEADEHELHVIENALNEFYVVERVQIQKLIRDTLRFDINALRNFNCLLIVQPDSVFEEKEKFVIDQFVMKGGKIAWFIDPMYVLEDTLFVKGQTMAFEKRLRLDDMLFTYGVRINKDMVVDHQSAPLSIPGYPGGWHPWYFFPLITPEGNHIITRNLDPIKTEYAASIEFVGEEKDMQKTVLLKSSPESFYYKNPVRVNYGIVEMDQVLWLPNKLKPDLAVAVLLEGKFKSVFKDRLNPEFMNSPDYTMVTESKPSKMLVVSDGDIIMNDVDSVNRNGVNEKRYLKLHIDKYKIQNPDGSPHFVYGNKEFILNAIDYLMGDEEIMAIRQRTITLRKLNMEKVIAEKSKWQFINVYMPVMLITFFGFAQNYLRKRKYTR